MKPVIHPVNVSTYIQTDIYIYIHTHNEGGNTPFNSMTLLFCTTVYERDY